MEPIPDRLRDSLPNGSFSGAQVYVSFRHGSYAEVLGPLHESTQFNLYCAGRPMVVLAALAQLESAGVACAPSVPIADLVHAPRADVSDEPATLGDLFSHNAGLGKPDLFTFLSTSTQQRSALLPSVTKMPNLERVRQYSSIALMSVLSTILRHSLDASVPAVVHASMHALKIDDVFVRSNAPPNQIGTYVEMRNGRPLPLLHDTLPRFHDSRWSELTGLFASANAVGRWLDSVSRVARGEIVPGLPSPRLFGSYLRYCDTSEANSPSYAAGFAAGLEDHGLSAASSSALGHFGFVRTALVYMCPVEELSVACILRELSLEDQDQRLHEWNGFIRRLRVLNDEAML